MQNQQENHQRIAFLPNLLRQTFVRTAIIMFFVTERPKHTRDAWPKRVCKLASSSHQEEGGVWKSVPIEQSSNKAIAVLPDLSFSWVNIIESQSSASVLFFFFFFLFFFWALPLRQSDMLALCRSHLRIISPFLFLLLIPLARYVTLFAIRINSSGQMTRKPLGPEPKKIVIIGNALDNDMVPPLLNRTFRRRCCWLFHRILSHTPCLLQS